MVINSMSHLSLKVISLIFQAKKMLLDRCLRKNSCLINEVSTKFQFISFSSFQLISRHTASGIMRTDYTETLKHK